MDTKFWGPSGWKMFHLATFTYEPSKQKKAMSKFLESLPYILPCKFCRASLTEYYEKHPYKSALESRAKLTKWLYDIHNEVNAKLRSQNLNPMPDPSFADIKKYYTTWIETSTPIERLSTYWDFLFSVGYGHPKESSKKSKPMPDCPPFAKKCKSKKIRNQWNTLNAKDRIPYYKQFWYSLPNVLEPALEITWRRALEMTEPNIRCRKSTMAWLWRMRCAIDTSYSDPYTDVCKTIASYSSDCSKSSSRIKTCRRKRT